jgi:hypothetical protein
MEFYLGRFGRLYKYLWSFLVSFLSPFPVHFTPTYLHREQTPLGVGHQRHQLTRVLDQQLIEGNRSDEAIRINEDK